MSSSVAQDGDDPDTQGLVDLAQSMPAEETQLLYSLCLHGRTELGLAPDEYAALTMVLLRLLAFKPPTGVAEKKSPRTSPQPITESAVTVSAVPRAESLPAVRTTPVTLPAAVHAAPMAHHVVNKPSAQLNEPAPWEDLPSTHDNAEAAADAFVASLAHAEPAVETPAFRSLPVREASDSARVDVPKAAPSSLQTTAEGDVWFAAVQGLMAQEVITALVRELALQSQLLARDADQWQLRIERESLNHPASRERLQAALAAAGHGQVRLQIELGPVTDCPAKRMAVAAAAKMVAAQELIENDPLVQTMMRDFGARIVPGSLQVI
jgi:DNA polymerase III subunit gamma/tau